MFESEWAAFRSSKVFSRLKRDDRRGNGRHSVTWSTRLKAFNQNPCRKLGKFIMNLKFLSLKYQNWRWRYFLDLMFFVVHITKVVHAPTVTEKGQMYYRRQFMRDGILVSQFSRFIFASCWTSFPISLLYSALEFLYSNKNATIGKSASAQKDWPMSHRTYGINGGRSSTISAASFSSKVQTFIVARVGWLFFLICADGLHLIIREYDKAVPVFSAHPSNSLLHPKQFFYTSVGKL